MYDYFLGGAHNFEIDRQLAGADRQHDPNLPPSCGPTGSSCAGPSGCLLDAGIDQFLDIGSGIPTVGNVHEVAQAANPKARVVYVDIDPVAVAHSRELLGGNELTGDPRRPARAGADPRRARQLGLIDFSRPMGILLAGVVHFIPDADRPGGHPGHPAGRRRAGQLPGRLALHLRGPAAGDAGRPAPLRRAPPPRSPCAPGPRSPASSATGPSWNRAWCTCRSGAPTHRPTWTSTRSGSAPSGASPGTTSPPADPWPPSRTPPRPADAARAGRAAPRGTPPTGPARCAGSVSCRSAWPRPSGCCWCTRSGWPRRCGRSRSTPRPAEEVGRAAGGGAPHRAAGPGLDAARARRDASGAGC